MCGECCHGVGGIIVKTDEIDRISGFLGLTPASFQTDYCINKGGRFSIKTGEDNFCDFYSKDKKCLINSVKPEICHIWPFFPANVRDRTSWELAKDACPGINPDCSFEEFVKQSED